MGTHHQRENTAEPWHFRELNREERAWLYQTYMTQDFPESELKPLSLLETLIAQGINSVWGCFQGENFKGYYVLAKGEERGMLLLDYLAVLPHLRGTGCGTAIMSELAKTLCEGEWLCIESEHPDAAQTPEERCIRQRRLAFYQGCGGVLSPMRVWLFGVDYAILTLGAGAPPTAEEQERAYRALYQKMLPEQWYQTMVKTTIALQAKK
jgi:GNAT superfamily N-acetyltransferase